MLGRLRLLFILSIPVALAFVLVAALNTQTATVAHDEQGASDIHLFRNSDYGYRSLVQLDPMTLEDESDGIATAIDPSIMPGSAIFSRDGSTLAGVTENHYVVVQRGLGGEIVSIFQAGEALGLIALSADGSKLLVEDWWSNTSLNPPPPVWRVFDTSSGTEIFTFPAILSSYGLAVDPVFWRMYNLTLNRPAITRSPWINREHEIKSGRYEIKGPDPTPPELIVTDLETGKEIDKLELPDLSLNGWDAGWEPTLDSDYPFPPNLHPAMALSPDGTEIAVVSAVDDGVTLIDTSTLDVTRTLTIKPKVGLVNRLFASLPLAPQSASAKVNEGVWRFAEYSADGSHLYVSGFKAWVEDNEQMLDGYGLNVVGLEDGTIESHLLDGVSVENVVEAGNGILYVSGADYSNFSTNRPAESVIARIDSDSTEVLAERRFEFLTMFVILTEPMS
jgi:hypothetical protein